MAAPRTPADFAREFARLPARFAGTFAAQIRWPRHRSHFGRIPGARSVPKILPKSEALSMPFFLQIRPLSHTNFQKLLTESNEKLRGKLGIKL